MYAALDPNGFRPLSIGRIGDSYVVASETCAFETVGAEFVRDVEPGELIIINDDGLRIEKFTDIRFVAWNIFILRDQTLILLGCAGF
ncbi:Amidophosphoribosyltransferase [Listeria monocytogenes]|nr:Amidophosphoribosyltransferase [Listeria monocytogenes]